MSSIPPSNVNLVAGIAQTSVSQRDRAIEKDTEKNRQQTQFREQTFLSDQQEHQVEDTLHLVNTRVRKHDDEESHQQRQHQHRSLPEDDIGSSDDETQDSNSHIDLQA